MDQEIFLRQVREALFSMQDVTYRDFQAKLMPTVEKEKIIGIRTPVLRGFARTFGKTKGAAVFLKLLPHTYYEENNLHALLIEQSRDYDECIEALDRFLPFVDNWATCDLMSVKMLKKYRERLTVEIDRWIASEHTYTVRFGIGLLMRYYLEEFFQTEYPQKVAAIRSDEYYVNMMRAWYFATALAKQYQMILPFMENGCLDIWTHNKTIQKAVESYRITPQQKAYLKTLKR